MLKPPLTADLLRSLVSYDGENGKFTWKPRPAEMFKAGGGRPATAFCDTWNTKFAGKEAFITPNPDGYLYARIFQKHVAAHRAAFAVTYGRWPQGDMDHINGDPADNRISNLREVSHAANGRNCKRRVDNTSGVTGVSKVGSGYAASICIDGNRRELGRFSSLDDAAAARKAAEQEGGFHENHGR